MSFAGCTFRLNRSKCTMWTAELLFLSMMIEKYTRWYLYVTFRKIINRWLTFRLITTNISNHGKFRQTTCQRLSMFYWSYWMILRCILIIIIIFMHKGYLRTMLLLEIKNRWYNSEWVLFFHWKFIGELLFLIDFVLDRRRRFEWERTRSNQNNLNLVYSMNRYHVLE